jgi:allantoinase
VSGRHDLAIVGARLVGGAVAGAGAAPDDEARRATVLLRDGRIASVQRPDEPFAADRVLDAEGMLLMPGAIDIHFHCRDPSFPERGDFATETRAAAAGGVTTVFEMPITKPCASTAAVVRDRRASAAAKAHVNVGLYGAPGRKDRAETLAMADEGVIGFKLFTTRSAPGREDEFLGLATEGLHDVLEALEYVAETGLRCVFHAETQDLIDLYTERASAHPGPDHLRHGASRPAVVEATAVAALAELARVVGTPIHIAHVTSAQTVDVIRRAKRSGAPMTAETCPHYLFCTEDDLAAAGPFGKINPPIRHAEDRDALWEGLEDGTLDVVATDHAPFTAAEKEAARGDILAAPPGHPGVEYLVPLIVGEALTGRMSIDRAVELISTRPARMFGMYPRKGVLAPGADADLTIYDPRSATTLRRGQGFGNAADCNLLYDGRTVQGHVHATLVAGKVVYQGGEVLGRPGDGAVLAPGREGSAAAEVHGD